MALTGKPQATICYNTLPFLANKLDTLVKARIIERYTYIVHDKDTVAETGELKKTHIHLWIKPGKRIDTLALRDEFDEVDPTNEKPLRCLNFKPSEESHWLRYVLHDPTYLELKGLGDEDGRTEYNVTDLVTNEPEELDAAYIKSAEVMNLSAEKQFFMIMDYITKYGDYVTYAETLEFAQANGCVKACLSMHQQVRALIAEHNFALNESSNQAIKQLKASVEAANDIHQKQLFTYKEKLNTAQEELSKADEKYGEIIDSVRKDYEERLADAESRYNSSVELIRKLETPKLF